MNNSRIFLQDPHEGMVEATLAAAAMRLPYYWFSHNTMREKLRIPHYLLGNLVRYRMSELALWAAKCNAVQNHAAAHSTDEGAS